jgi:hypothetical protein
MATGNRDPVGLIRGVRLGAAPCQQDGEADETG